MRWGYSLLALALATACATATYDTHDDLTISTHVKIALIDDARLGEFRINAATSHGIVTLSGTVGSQADVDRAIGIAKKVRGVRDVKSELRVAGNQSAVTTYQLPVAFRVLGER
jgi:BON domain